MITKGRERTFGFWDRKTVFILAFAFAAGSSVISPKGTSADYDKTSSTTWNFSSPSNFTISDSSKLKFSEGSVKIIPTGAVSDGYYSFKDSVWNGANSTVWINALVVDSDGNTYIGGNVNEDTTNPAKEYYSFIEKLDSNFHTVWNQKYAVTPGHDPDYGRILTGGFDNVILSADGQFLYGLSLGVTKVGGVPTASNVRTYKINTSDGSVVWLKERIKTVYADREPWACTWDEGNGPKLDSEGNIYVSYSDGCRTNIGPYGMSGPIVMVKYDANGNELWSTWDDLVGPGERPTCTRIYPAYEDSWEMVVDSEDSAYIASSYWGPTTANMNYIVTKFDKDGNLDWKDMRDYGDLGGGWDSPRSLSIDSNDYIYVNGNPPTSATQSCLLRKLDKNGNVIIDYQNLNPTGVKDDFSYCWGATIDKFDRWVSVSQNATGAIHTMAYYKQLGVSALSLEEYIQFQISNASDVQAVFRTVYDKYGNIYSIVAQYTDAGGKSAAILKAKNTYPDTMPASGTPVTLINKTGLAYENLSSFSVGYGEADQNDVGFQISDNGTDWYWWNGSTWVKTTGNDYNSAATINSNISSFSSQVGSGTFYFKTFMLTDGTKQVDLASVTVSEGPIPISTSTATASSTATSTVNVLPETGGNKYLFWAMGLN